MNRTPWFAVGYTSASATSSSQTCSPSILQLIIQSNHASFYYRTTPAKTKEKHNITESHTKNLSLSLISSLSRVTRARPRAENRHSQDCAYKAPSSLRNFVTTQHTQATGREISPGARRCRRRCCVIYPCPAKPRHSIGESRYAQTCARATTFYARWSAASHRLSSSASSSSSSERALSRAPPDWFLPALVPYLAAAYPLTERGE